MTDNTQELEAVAEDLWVRYGRPGTMDDFITEAKQSILDWHNKQVEAKLAHISEYAENVISIDENGEFSMKAIPLSLVAVERNKLKESSNGN